MGSGFSTTIEVPSSGEPLSSSSQFSVQPEIAGIGAFAGVILPSATPNRKRGKSMSFRSGQSGTVVRKGKMWHGRYYVDVPGQAKRRKVSVPLGSTLEMKKNEAKRKLRALLDKMGLNEDSHLERTEAGARTFAF